MSTGVDSATTGATGMRRTAPLADAVVRGLDVVLVVVAAIVAVAAGAPALGAIIGAGVWILQRLVAVLDRRWADRLRVPARQASAILIERFGRIWLLAAGIVVSAVIGGRHDGLTTTLLVCGAYTFVFLIRLFSGPPPAREDA